MTNADILKAAKQLLIDHKWVKGDNLACSSKYKDCYCAATAIGEALDRGGFRDSAMHPVFNTFKDAAGIPRDQGIGPWNDARVRTKHEVLAAFDKAIALAEAET